MDTLHYVKDASTLYLLLIWCEGQEEIERMMKMIEMKMEEVKGVM
jgi:hypothetical protein